MKSYYKVPFRDVYCSTVAQWLKAVFRCHIWLRIFKPNLPKIGLIAALALCIGGASAQTVVYQTNVVTLFQTNTVRLVDTNPAPPVIGGEYASVLAFLTTGSNWMFGPYGIYSVNDHKTGFGLFAGYKISDNVVTLLRGDYFDHSFWMPSLSIQLQAPVKLMQAVTVVPFTFGGVATPLGNGMQGTVVGLLGAGAAVRLDFIKSTGFFSRSDLVFDYELWQGMPESQRKQVRVGYLYRF